MVYRSSEVSFSLCYPIIFQLDVSVSNDWPKQVPRRTLARGYGLFTCTQWFDALVAKFKGGNQKSEFY